MFVEGFGGCLPAKGLSGSGGFRVGRHRLALGRPQWLAASASAAVFLVGAQHVASEAASDATLLMTIPAAAVICGFFGLGRGRRLHGLVVTGIAAADLVRHAAGSGLGIDGATRLLSVYAVGFALTWLVAGGRRHFDRIGLHLSHLGAATTVGLMRVGSDGSIATADRIAEDIFGIGVGSIVGTVIDDLLVEQQAWSRIQAATGRDSQFGPRYERTRAGDGSERIIRLFCRPTPDSSGDVLLSAEDVTAREWADRELGLLRMITERAMGAAGTTDMLIAASEAVSSVLRIPTVDAWLPGTLDGVDHMTAVSSASDDRVRPPPGADLAARSWRSGRPAWGDDILRANGDDGRASLMPGLALPIPGSGGTLGVLTLPGVGSHRATEVRSIAASALRALGQAVQRLQAEERYRRATDSLPDLVMVHGAERILHVNAAAVRMLRAESAEEIVDKPLLSVFDPGEWEAALAQASAVLGGGPAVAASIVRCGSSASTAPPLTWKRWSPP